MENRAVPGYPSCMEEECRVFLIGDSLFTESLGQILANAENIRVVGTAVSPASAVTAVAKVLPRIIIVANTSDNAQTNLQPLLSIFPTVPIIQADLNRDYIQIITSRRVSARRTDLLAAINDLSTRPGD